jgi:hypothetical protein
MHACVLCDHPHWRVVDKSYCILQVPLNLLNIVYVCIYMCLCFLAPKQFFHCYFKLGINIFVYIVGFNMLGCVQLYATTITRCFGIICFHNSRIALDLEVLAFVSTFGVCYSFCEIRFSIA